MKYSRQLLRSHIAVQWTDEQISQYLTTHSCEVEEVITRIIPAGVVVGYTRSVEKHPDADTLRVCTVDCGSRGTYTICTAAENVLVNRYYPTALPDTHLPALDMTIGIRKMRGIESAGMLCAKTELGIDEDSHIHGIWDMEDDFVMDQSMCGQSLRDIWPRLEASIFDVDNKTITNRPDLTGHRGIANELYALAKRHEPKTIILHSIHQGRDSFGQRDYLQALEFGTQSTLRATIKCPDVVKTYLAYTLDGVTVKPSSMYTRTLLRDCGLQPKNNRVDLGNLCMIMYGQPVHFFDADKISGDIIVRRAKPDETFADLMGTTHKLTTNDIVISDQTKILALAGIIGGKDSAISDHTTRVVCEIAHFDPVTIRKTSQRLGIRTDASMRYEKNLSPVLPIFVHSLMMDMIKKQRDDLGGYTYAGHLHVVDPAINTLSCSPRQIMLDPTHVSRIIAGDDSLAIQTQIDFLTSLGFSAQLVNNQLSVIVPQWRGGEDITIPEDCIEEIARIHGYDMIEPTQIITPLRQAKKDPMLTLKRTIEGLFVQQYGCTQIETYPRYDDQYTDLLAMDPSTLVTLRNPLTPETATLRDRLAPVLLDAIRINHKFFDTIRIMDIGQAWSTSYQSVTKPLSDVGEITKAGFAWTARRNTAKKWSEDIFIQLKEAIQTLLTQQKIDGTRHHHDQSFAHPRKSLRFYSNDLCIAEVYELHPSTARAAKISETLTICIGEINCSALLATPRSTQKPVLITLRDQIVGRDLTFVTEKGLSADAIVRTVAETPGVLDVSITDIYAGSPLLETQQSLSLHYRINGDGSRTTEEINAMMQTIIDRVVAIGGHLRME